MTLSLFGRNDTDIITAKSSAEKFGVQTVWGLQFSMAQNKIPKSASWVKCQLGEVPNWGSAS